MFMVERVACLSYSGLSEISFWYADELGVEAIGLRLISWAEYVICGFSMVCVCAKCGWI